MKRILLTSALAGVLAASASTLAAQTQTAPASDQTTASAQSMEAGSEFLNAASATSHEASDVIGARVYVYEGERATGPVTSIEDDWDDVGEVHDLLVTEDGRVEAILVDVGGFLGMGEKTVAVNAMQLNFVHGEDNDEWFVVFPGTKESLEAAPEYDDEMTEASATSATTEQQATDMTKDSEAASTEAADSGIYTAPAPKLQREGDTPAKVEELTSENLTGAPVYDVNDEKVGDVNKLILSEDGKIKTSIIDVGGFLGIGEKPVAVDFASLQIVNDNNGDLRVFVDVTEESLKNMPRYED